MMVAVASDPVECGAALVLHFDGACWPNPGGEAAYGWTLAREDGRAVARGAGPVDDAFRSNNVAEWRGLEAGLRWLSCLAASPARLVIRGDSQLVVHQLTGAWGCKKDHLRALRDECRRLLRILGCEWEARWLPRAENGEADALSKSRPGRTLAPAT